MVMDMTVDTNPFVGSIVISFVDLYVKDLTFKNNINFQGDLTNILTQYLDQIVKNQSILPFLYVVEAGYQTLQFEGH